MKLMLATLAATAVIAVVAAVFAIWPVVADAPWENEVSQATAQPSVEQRSARCENVEQAFLDALVEDARDEVVEYLHEQTTRYC